MFKEPTPSRKKRCIGLVSFFQVSLKSSYSYCYIKGQHVGKSVCEETYSCRMYSKIWVYPSSKHKDLFVKYKTAIMGQWFIHQYSALKIVNKRFWTGTCQTTVLLIFPMFLWLSNTVPCHLLWIETLNILKSLNCFHTCSNHVDL